MENIIKKFFIEILFAITFIIAISLLKMYYRDFLMIGVSILVFSFVAGYFLGIKGYFSNNLEEMMGIGVIADQYLKNNKLMDKFKRKHGGSYADLISKEITKETELEKIGREGLDKLARSDY